MVYSPKGQEGSAPFNMALATLERLNEILIEIKRVYADPTIPLGQKQTIIINLTKMFYLQACPLLPEKFKDKNTDKVLNIQPVTANFYNNTSVGKKFYKIDAVFNVELEIKLHKILLNTEEALQSEGYFMPPKNDPRFGWKG